MIVLLNTAVLYSFHLLFKSMPYIYQCCLLMESRGILSISNHCARYVLPEWMWLGLLHSWEPGRLGLTTRVSLELEFVFWFILNSSFSFVWHFRFHILWIPSPSFFPCLTVFLSDWCFIAIALYTNKFIRVNFPNRSDGWLCFFVLLLTWEESVLQF